MPGVYTLCKAVTKRFRTLEVYGCSATRDAMENFCACNQGNYNPVGCCCAWVVPTGVTQIQVELWGAGGGGGAGSGGECCGTHPGGGGATYGKFTLPVTPGVTLTLCAGAGGRGGAGNESTASYCCCGAQGNCSYVACNGTILVDASGGLIGYSQCYESCGCVYYGCGGSPVLDATTTACGAFTTQNQGTRDLAIGPGVAMSWGCDGQCSQQMNWGAASGWGSSPQQWNADCNCWFYYAFNTGCTNSNGITGVATGYCAYNIPSSGWYTCSTSTGWLCCGREYPGTNGNFPGGGGAAGVKSGCCCSGSSGGHGAAGYVRITY